MINKQNGTEPEIDEQNEHNVTLMNSSDGEACVKYDDSVEVFSAGGTVRSLEEDAE